MLKALNIHQLELYSICCQISRSKTLFKISIIFHKEVNKPINYMFLKDFANNREKIDQVATNQFFVVYNVVCWKIQKSAGILKECIIISVVPSHFFVLLNLYGFANIEAKVSLKISKMSLDRAIKCILSYSRDSS